MTASDCFYLGMESNNNGETAFAILWLKEALRRFDENNDDTKLLASIKGYLALVHYEKGR